MNNAKYAFYYLLSLVALVFIAVNGGLVIFQIINKLMPDSLTNYSDSVNQEALRFAIASLIFATPVFYWLNKMIRQGLVKKEIPLTAGVRRWLTYLIIFTASVVILVWLITTMNSFLNGELSGKVILKTLTILLIAGSVFGYYFYDIKLATIKPKDIVARIFCYGSLILITAIFVAAWFFVDSPSIARDRRHDQTVIDNFSAIDNGINQYWQINKKLPIALADLNADGGNMLRVEALADPLTKAPYQYKIISDGKYQLCAVFKLATDKDNKFNYIDPKWDHLAGAQCLTSVVVKQDNRPAPPVK